MGKSDGKRHRTYREDSEKNQRRRSDRDRDEKGNEELIVYRILCPGSVMGSVIGKSGKVINTIRQDSRAKVKVVDPFPGSNERVMTIYCYVREKEEMEVDRPLCPAQYALLMVHSSIANAVYVLDETDRKQGDRDREECQLLVPSSQSANIIGKSGLTIKKLRNKTRANIKIVLRLRDDVLKDIEDIHNSSFGASLPVPFLRSVPCNPALRHEQRADSGLGLLSSSEYGCGSLSMGDKGYGSLSSHPSSLYAGMPPPSSLEMLIPGDAVGKVIGRGGTNIENIRKISGAVVEVSESKSSRGDRMALISGTSDQKRAAENLIQAFIMAA